MTTYADGPEAWNKVVAAVRAAGICGLDTETYGHDIRKTSAPYRARIHVWSLAVLTPKLHPRGHHIAAGVVLPVVALDYPPIREMLEDPTVKKVAHNAPHDIHSMKNHDIEVRGWVDSLPWARVLLTDFLRHGLKTLCCLVGRRLCKYKEVVSMLMDVPVNGRGCSCGVEGCKKKTSRKGVHERVDVVRYVEKIVELPLETIVPGHALWLGLVEYAAEDAVVAIELFDYMSNVAAPSPLPPVPWAPTWTKADNE